MSFGVAPNLPPLSIRRTGPIVILGAGLAGLSLACALLDEEVEDEIVLIDRRTRWERDRTWCTWSTRPVRFLELASHSWPAWRVTAGERSAVARSARHPYVHLSSETVYDAALERLARARNVTVRPGERVLSVGPGATVVTSAESFSAGVVFDGLGGGSPLLRGRPAGGIELAQRFLGWEVEVDRPLFDPGVATLMDFRGEGGGGLRFLYVLPYSSTRALIEDTSIGGSAVPRAERRRALEADLGQRLGARSWEVRFEEQGAIPMSSFTFPLAPAEGVHTIGTAAGAVRPSSGYAFSRIQAHCDRVARAVACGRSLPSSVAPPRFGVLDRVFLQALADDPDRAPEIFLRLAAALPGDAFARFMTDSSTALDEAVLIAALPKLPFLSSAAQLARGARRPQLSTN